MRTTVKRRVSYVKPCPVCNGTRMVFDAKTKKARTCVMCAYTENGTWIDR
jgi:hypothetical protein